MQVLKISWNRSIAIIIFETMNLCVDNTEIILILKWWYGDTLPQLVLNKRI